LKTVVKVADLLNHCKFDEAYQTL